MPYYKDANNRVHFIDQDKFDAILPRGCIRISPEEAIALLQPTPEQVQAVVNFEARKAAKVKAIATNLPAWITVKALIDQSFLDAKQNRIITGLARVLYWLAKDQAD